MDEQQKPGRETFPQNQLSLSYMNRLEIHLVDRPSNFMRAHEQLPRRTRQNIGNSSSHFGNKSCQIYCNVIFIIYS
jgi:hypothetical protein